MNNVFLVAACFVLMICLFLAGMHTGIAMAFVGLAGIFFIRLSGGFPIGAAFEMALGSFVNGPFSSTSKETLTVIPMFTFMGILCSQGGISKELYNACYKWSSRLRGGLAIATITACALFGAVCGSATATTASMGKICLPEMDRYHYSRRLSCGAVSAGGTLGILIPPSTGFMLYGVSAGIGVGKMFIAGIFPGIILSACYIIIILFICRLDQAAGPSGPAFSLREKIHSLKGLIPVLLLFLFVLGGILTGWCSATEGGAVGVLGAFLILFLRGRLGWKQIEKALVETMGTTAMIFLILIGSDILSQFLALTHVSAALSEAVLLAGLNRWVILLLCLLIFAVLGCFVDTLPLICLLTPLFLPLIKQAGFDTVWFGVLMVMLMEFGLLTPPVGMCCYVMAGLTGDSTALVEIFKGTAPFLIGLTAAIILVMLCPSLATWLPGLVAG